MNTISVFYADGFQAHAERVALALSVPSSPDYEIGDQTFYLVVDEFGLSLKQAGKKAPGPIRVDFDQGASAHRRQYGGGKSQMIAKAVGLNKKVGISVLDATAGMGGDAFVLASLGCQVSMIERTPLVYQLLKDGLERAASSFDPTLKDVMERMTLMEGDSTVLLSDATPVDVVYLDPMFPERTKSAKVKKEMSTFHELVGKDLDADNLLAPAIGLAKHRVVVKRPRKAPLLDERAPTYQIEGKTSRYDIYVNAAFDD